MKAEHSSETSANIYQSTQHNIFSKHCGQVVSTSVLYLGGAQFVSTWILAILIDFSWVSSVLPGKCQDSTSN
jgi:hypothetical protein